MDAMVLETQKWLNKTYGSVANYVAVPENGQTGWPTIYGLIQGMQHELGISLREGAPAFGDTTAAAYDSQVVPKLKAGYKDNVVYLIQGAFWAKGINPQAFTGIYSNDTTAAIESLQADAGIPTTGVLDSQLAQALFDMSAFILVSGGDRNVRQMQQHLNANYRQYTGILPADGIYQRATNTALIYGVQVELGLENIANGFWGPTTIATYRSAFADGLSQQIIQLVQYALYVNMKEYMAHNGGGVVSFNGPLDSATQNVLSEFQKFMRLDPVKSGQPDSTTMYSLMLSSGSPARNFFGMDTSYQLDNAMIQALVNYEVNYVGRYLTGSVGVGASQRNKNLTRTEAQDILNAGLKLVPIYQDNNPHLAYFDYDQGMTDAKLAVSAALNIGIPNGHTIYFAIDMDMTDDEITVAAIPYFRGVAAGISHYNIGVYGTRNVSSRVSQSVGSVKYSYVSNMSTGFSGNLGFSQPVNWAFDQFFEDDNGVGPLPALDRVAVSNIDGGVTSLVASQTSDWIDDSTWSSVKNLIANGKLTFGGEPVTLIESPEMKLTVKYQNTTSVGSGSIFTPTFAIKNGKIDSNFINYASQSNGIIGSYALSNAMDKLTVGLTTGFVTIGIDQSFDLKQANLGLHMSLAVSNRNPHETTNQAVKNTTSIIFDIYLSRNPLKKAAMTELTPEQIRDYNNMMARVGITAAGIVVVGLGSIAIVSALSAVASADLIITAAGLVGKTIQIMLQLEQGNMVHP